MDLVIKLGSGSSMADWELRYALRSWRAHYRDLGHVWLVGHRPHWLREDADLTHVPAPDPFRAYKDGNLILKLLRCAGLPLSDQFAWASDDVLVTAPLASPQVGCYYRSDRARESPPKRPPSEWFARHWATVAALREAGCTAYDYDTPHLPIRATRDRILPALTRFKLGGVKMTCSTLYANAAGETPRHLPSDGRVRFRADAAQASQPAPALAARMAATLFTTYNDEAFLNPHFAPAVEARFPDASPWEGDA
jgi:hypothetical protein